MTQTTRPSPPAPPPQFAFGPFRLDLANARLLRDGRPVALTPKALEVLHHLAGRPQRLVTKDELLDAVWPDVLVSDASIKVCVREIRKALDDDVKTPTYIETVHRRGYRFIAPVSEDKSGPVTVPVVDSSPAQAGTPEPGAISATDLAQVTAPALGVTAPRHAIVGRYDELRQLAGVFTRALAGRTQCVFVTGGPGSGKTTLVDAFTQLVHFRKWQGATERPLVLAGHCFERFGTSEPYMPVWEALGRLAQKRPSPELSALLARHNAAYVQPAPQPNEPLRTLINEPATSDRLLREIADAIERLAAVGSGVPLLLVLEDVHWADYSTLDLLTALTRRRAPAQLMVIATYRPAEVLAAEHPLRGIVQWLLSGELCWEVALDFLDESAVAQFLAVRFPGGQLPAVLASKLHQRTGGYPLFLVNLVNDLVTQGLFKKEGDAWHVAGTNGSDPSAPAWAMLESHVPQTVRAMIDAQLDRLERDERQVLEAAAIAGVAFSAAAAAAAIGAQDVVHVEQVCDELDRRGRFLIACGVAEWPDGTAATQYRFIHELYHNVVYEQVPIARRVRMHQALGVKLEAAWGSRVTEGAAQLASHFEAARDWPRAVKYLRQAAEAASRHYAHREAVHYLRRALGVLERLAPDVRIQHELAVLMSLGVNLQVTKGFAAPEVQAVHDRAQALCQADGAGDVRGTFPVLWGIWLFHKVRSDLRRADEMARKLLAMAQQTGKSALLLQAHQAVSVTNLCLGNPAETVRQMEQAAAIYNPAQHAGNTEYYGQDPGVATQAFGAVALQILDRSEEASAACERALELARRLDQPSSLALSMHFAAMLHQLRGDADAAERWAQSTIDLASGEGFSFWQAGGIVLHGWALVARNGEGAHAETGLAEIQRGLDSWLATGSRTYHTYYLGLLADALLRLDRPAEALLRLDEALEAARSLPEGLYEAELHRLRGQALARKSKSSSDAARECFQQAVAIARRQGATAFEARAAAELGAPKAKR